MGAFGEGETKQPALLGTKWGEGQIVGPNLILSIHKQGEEMQPDPFGNLRDWGPVLDHLHELTDNGKLSECQPGLTRILAFQGNWRLREETLKRIGFIQYPSNELICQVMNMIADANIYYEMRIIACEAIEELLSRDHHHFYNAMQMTLLQTVLAQLSTPQPPIFKQALENLYASACERFSIAVNA
jgi:hypothetical protein